MVPVSGRTLVSDALQEIGALSQGETASAGDALFGLGKLNRVLDNWNAERRAIYADQIVSYTLTPNLSPHTLGSNAATWVIASRPVSIEHAAIVINDAYTPIDIISAQQYAEFTTPTLTSEIPTALYPAFAWPNAKLYFYPVPSAAYVVRLLIRIVLSDFTLDDLFDLPPGYRDAVTLSLAEECAGSFGKPVDPDLLRRASKARARIQANNLSIPTLATQADSRSCAAARGHRDNGRL